MLRFQPVESQSYNLYEKISMCDSITAAGAFNNLRTPLIFPRLQPGVSRSSGLVNRFNGLPTLHSMRCLADFRS